MNYRTHSPLLALLRLDAESKKMMHEIKKCLRETLQQTASEVIATINSKSTG